LNVEPVGALCDQYDLKACSCVRLYLLLMYLSDCHTIMMPCPNKIKTLNASKCVVPYNI
jgi:hypothetical protein